MNLRELLKKVVSSSKNDWNTIVCWGAFSGPSYHDKLEFWDIYEEQKHVLKLDSHSTVASYKPDVSITMAWGLESSKDFKEPWANKFPDPQASGHFVDIFFNNSLVYRDSYVSVDGGRAKLPIPKSRVELLVPSDYSRLIQLVDEIGGYISDYQRYFREAGLKIVDVEWPK